MINRKTKIIATIGPATLEKSIYQRLVDEGIDYIRINTAYGDPIQYDRIIQNMTTSQSNKTVQVILDIKSLKPLDYALKNNISQIAVSFTNTADQIREIRAIIPHGFIIAKIETEAGLSNLNEILQVSDGIMVARGDLGRATPLERIPLLQKEITYQAINRKKLLITATEMLFSMVKNNQPTRAEVSDVANAVLDHSSAVMLSEETAIGKYPVEAVRFMRRVIEETEIWEKNWATKKNS